MSLLAVTLLSISILLLGYHFYGKFLARAFALDDRRVTPAVEKNDGVDFVPARPSILVGQHFAAIAAVGPIAGPILGGMIYGWLPSLIWIALGAVFIGGLHDFAALVSSVRNGGKSVAELMDRYVGKKAYVLFLLFMWLSLLYVVVVFTDLTASAFVSRPELGAENFGPGVASSSFLYLALCVAMGLCLYKWNWNLAAATGVFVPLLFLTIFIGQKFPVELPALLGSQQKTWDLLILGYCFLASVLPMWILLQPRGYLGATILYVTFAAGVFGTLFGGYHIEYPAFIPQSADAPRLPIFPLLFTSIACGACSGFHGMVSSGTTSKQLQKESHARLVGYGGMMLEAFVAIVALSTVMMISKGDRLLDLGPDEIYARGLAHFIAFTGVPFAAAVTFGKLAFATFIYDTLDVATRLGRYIFQELTGLEGRSGAIAATFVTLAIPGVMIFIDLHDAAGKAIPLWKIFWPVFGATNQLLAALTLLGVTVWMRAENRKWWIAGVPALFMLGTTLSSLFLIVKPWASALFSGGPLFHPVGTTAFFLLLVAAVLLASVAPRLRPRQILNGALAPSEEDQHGVHINS